MINASSSIVIKKDIESVFNYYADLTKDKEWRTEINFTTISDNIEKLNSIAIENSFLSKRVSNHTTELICVEYIPNQKIVYQTLPNARFFLKSIREVSELTDGTTQVNYTIQFDKAVVKHGLGFNLPNFIITSVTKKDMKKYLKNLSNILEGKNE